MAAYYGCAQSIREHSLPWHISGAGTPHVQWLLCYLMPALMSVSSIEGIGTSVAPAMLAQCIHFVTKISICANNGGHQQQLQR